MTITFEHEPFQAGVCRTPKGRLLVVPRTVSGDAVLWGYHPREKQVHGCQKRPVGRKLYGFRGRSQTSLRQ